MRHAGRPDAPKSEETDTGIWKLYGQVAMQGVQAPDAPNSEDTDTEVVIKSALSSA